MPILYHGTSQAFASAMATTPGTIDVTRGRGEFGRGFYTQGAIGNAARRGDLLYGNARALLILNIDDLAYRQLAFKRLTLNGAQMLDARLKGNNTRDSYTTLDDVIVGPIVTQPRIMQQKFQSVAAGRLLNGAST